MALRKHALSMVVMAAMLATCFAADNINLSEELHRVQQRRNNILEGRRADFNKPLRMQPGDLEALAQLESRKHQHAEAPYGHHEPDGNHDSYHGRDNYGPTHYEHPCYEGDGCYRTEHDPYGSGPADYGYYPPPSHGNLTTDSRTLIIANYGPAGTAYPQFIGAYLEYMVAAESLSQGDGVYGDWSAAVWRDVNLKATDRKFLTVSETSRDITLWGTLTDATQAVRVTADTSTSFNAFWWGIAGGSVPDIFKFEVSPDTCQYNFRCAADTASTLNGNIEVVSPSLGRVTFSELVSRDWFPKEPVRFVCRLDSTPAEACSP